MVSFSDALDKVIPREAREFADKVVPNELKGYLGTAASLAIPFGGGILGGAAGSFLTDILMQKLLYDEDADKDTDYLKALTSGIIGGAKNIESGFLGDRDPVKRIVDIDKAGIEFDPTTNNYQAITKGDNSAIGLSKRLNMGDASPLTPGPTISGAPMESNYFKSDFLSGIADAATPFQYEGITASDTPLMDIAKETSSSLGILQAGNTPSQVRDASKALEEAEARYQNYLNQLDEEARASIEADRTARVAAYKKYMALAGYSEEEINDALIKGGYLEEGGTAYAAQGGRIGFDVGGGTGARTDQMGIGNYIAAEQMRADFTNDLQSGLLLAQANMREQEFKKDQIKKQMQDQRRNLFNDTVNMIDDRFADNREQRKMANMGGMMNARMGYARGTDPYMERYREKELDPFEGGFEPGDGPERFPDYEGVNPFNETPGNAGVGSRNQDSSSMFQKARIMQIQKMFEAGQISREEAIIQIRNIMSADTVRSTMNMGGSMNMMDRPNFNYGSGRQTSQGDPIAPNVPPGKQMDLRPGGFIELGTKPKADDVPAMVGKNEFVLNDEAVSGIGKMITGKADPRAGARALYELQSQMESIV